MVDEGGITLRTGDDGNLEPDPTGHTLEKQMALTSTPAPTPPAPPPPVNECNYTMENRYCPVHGLEDCGSMGMFESELARIKSLSSFK